MNDKKFHMLAAAYGLICFSAFLIVMLHGAGINIPYTGWLHETAIAEIYILLWLGSALLAIRSASILYGWRPHWGGGCLACYLLGSVIMCLSGFSLAYFHLSKIHPDLAFNTKLTPVSAFYFSIVTFTTAGYGDIYPTSDATKLVVCVELIFAMLYAIFVFSALAAYIRDYPADKLRPK